MKKSFNIQELLHRKFKCHGTKPIHPSSLRAFQRDQEHDLKDASWMDFISTNKTKQNKIDYVSFLIEELTISKLQLFSIYSFLYVLLDPHKKNSCWRGANKNSFSFVQMRDNVIYVNP